MVDEKPDLYEKELKEKRELYKRFILEDYDEHSTELENSRTSFLQAKNNSIRSKLSNNDFNSSEPAGFYGPLTTIKEWFNDVLNPGFNKDILKSWIDNYSGIFGIRTKNICKKAFELRDDLISINKDKKISKDFLNIVKELFITGNPGVFTLATKIKDAKKYEEEMDYFKQNYKMIYELFKDFFESIEMIIKLGVR